MVRSMVRRLRSGSPLAGSGRVVRRGGRVLAAGLSVWLAAASAAQPKEAVAQEPDIDMVALMPGKCGTLRVAGQEFGCSSVVYTHSQQGRANFTIVLDDPADDRHMISFSGETAKREQDNLYELAIDQVQLNSKDRPKVDGLRVPFVALSNGSCTQLGNFATKQVSSISCSATGDDARQYELKFESDGAPITVWRIRRYSLAEKRRRAKLSQQLECRQKADAAKVLPRDLTAYLLQCLGEDNDKAASSAVP